MLLFKVKNNLLTTTEIRRKTHKIFRILRPNENVFIGVWCNEIMTGNCSDQIPVDVSQLVVYLKFSLAEEKPRI